MLTTGKARTAFALEKEPESVRDRYGRGKWGQSVLLSRRLIEAGVRFVHVQWPREPGDLSSSAPLWDTHANNDKRVKSILCPQFDVGFSALIEDLDARGLLDETLVVATGEFGRTPKFNANGGRDHWGPVFSFALAGAGLSSRATLRRQRFERRVSPLRTHPPASAWPPQSSICWASATTRRCSTATDDQHTSATANRSINYWATPRQPQLDDKQPDW